MNFKFAYVLLIVLTTALAAGLSGVLERPSQQSHRFTALGDLAGGACSSAAYGVSADGSVVVGCSNAETGVEAFRWTSRGGMVGLGFAEAFAASADGSAVVGFRCVAGGTEPVRWTQNDGLHGLGHVAGCTCGTARGTSSDGSFVVGNCSSISAVAETAFHWTPASGIVRLELFPNAVVGVDSYAVSSDGKTVVGAVQHEPGRSTAFRWTSKSGLVDLGVLPGDTESMAHGVSGDGSVVVGISLQSGEAFRWTEATGMVGLGTLPGGGSSCAFGASADGSIIVGQSNGVFRQEAFIWDATHGMRSLRQLLITECNLGATLHKWKLRSATAVSRDGSTIVGYGINPSGKCEAWIARLGEKPTTDSRTFRIAAR